MMTTPEIYGSTHVGLPLTRRRRLIWMLVGSMKVFSFRKWSRRFRGLVVALGQLCEYTIARILHNIELSVRQQRFDLVQGLSGYSRC